MDASLTNESATSKEVYFAYYTLEMIYITHLLAKEPKKLVYSLAGMLSSCIMEVFETPSTEKSATEFHSLGLLHSASKAEMFSAIAKKVLMEIINDSPITCVAQRRRFFAKILGEVYYAKRGNGFHEINTHTF
eukprot:Gb_02130 [translate_table: standard]